MVNKEFSPNRLTKLKDLGNQAQNIVDNSISWYNTHEDNLSVYQITNLYDFWHNKFIRYISCTHKITHIQDILWYT